MPWAAAKRSGPATLCALAGLFLTLAGCGAQRNYTLPVVPMTQTERAQLLHTMALSAIKQGDVTTGKGLLREAINTHPQHFDEAARALDALETG